jgi:hypothetical protein
MISLGRSPILASSGIERELHSGGNIRLVDTAQGVTNRLLGDAPL